MMEKQITFFDSEAEIRKQHGMRVSVKKADREDFSWSDRALLYVKEFICRFPNKPFLVEEVRAFAYSRKLDRPKNDRAWGAVICKAAKAKKWIHSVGHRLTSNPRAHKTPATLWMRRPDITFSHEGVV